MKDKRRFPSAGLLLSSLLLSQINAHAQTNRAWTGAGGDGVFTTAENWDPAGSPRPEDSLTLANGTATNTGNLNRGGLTTISGAGALAVPAGRFLNASGFPATVDVQNGGALTHSGEYFIAAMNNVGDITQSGGAVTSAVTTAWFLSDGANAKGTYTLTGGTLDVTISGTSGGDRQIHLGKQSNGDLLHIDGGTATFSAASPDRRFYLSRQSTLQLDSGALNVNAFQYFILGRELAAGSNSTLLVNGGTLAINDMQSNGAFVIGAPNDGVFRLNGGAVTSATGSVWLGDGAGRVGTVTQTGGSFTLAAGDVVLARAGGSFGHYQMSGGTLTANTITAGGGAGAVFAFREGEITLPGDQRAILSQPWFYAAGNVTATYDDVNDLTKLKAVPPTARTVTYQYYRFTGTKLRDAATPAIQIAEFEFLKSGVSLERSGITVTNDGGDNPAGETPEMILDGLASTKWFDGGNHPIVFDFGAPTAIDGYRFTTAADFSGRDPLRWTVEGSSDGATWDVLDRPAADAPVPQGRGITTLAQSLPLPATSLTWTGAQSAQWNLTQPNWTGPVGAQPWNNTSVLEAVFAAAGPKNISTDAPVTASALRFTAPGYTLGGAEPITLTTPAVVTASASATLAAPVAGTAGLRKEGTEILTVTAPLAHTGLTALVEGTTVFAPGSSSSGNGNLTVAEAANARAELRVESDDSFTYTGSVLLGRGDGSAGVIRQSAGTVTVGGPGVQYLEIGGGGANPSGSYGSYHLSGGTLQTSAAGPSGTRVGSFGLGVFTQTGGVLENPRWFAIGGAGNSLGDGVASFLGGEATVGAGYRFLIGDRGAVNAALNLGTLAGGTASVTSLNNAGLAVAANGGAASATLNLNAGTLTLGGPVFRVAGGAAVAVNANGATLRAGAPEIILINDTLPQVNILNGGLVIDTDVNNASVTTSLIAPMDNGVYPAGGGFPVAAGGAGYLGAPLVTVTSSGAGWETTAIAEISNGAVSRVALTSPGQGHSAGDTLFFEFRGGGATEPALMMEHVLTASDVAPNNKGGLTKTGLGRLTTTAGLAYFGETRVLEGTLASDGLIEGTTVSVAAGAELTGNINTTAPIVVAGTLAPGNGAGLIQGAALTLSAGATLAVDLADWSGPAGTGYDSGNFSALTVSASAQSRLRIALDTTRLVNFTESEHSFTLLSATTVTGLQADNWEVSAPGFPGAGSWSLEVQTGNKLVLHYAPGAGGGGYTTWAAGFPGLTDAAAGSDPDRDGVSNLLEYALAGNPTQTNATVLPVPATAAGGFAFTFTRLRSSLADTTQVFEYGSALTGWTAVPLPAASAGNVVITPDSPSAGLDEVKVTLPASAAVDGRIFGRLRVTQAN